MSRHYGRGGRSGGKKVLIIILSVVLLLGATVGVCAAGSAKDGVPFKNPDIATWFNPAIMKKKPAQGLQGPKGDKGDKGDPGEQGAAGADGVTPHIGENGNWFIGETDTGIAAQGIQGEKGDAGATGATGAQGEKGEPGAAGADGVTPHIGDNGNWFIGETDTGIAAQGEKGEKGDKGDKGDAGTILNCDYVTVELVRAATDDSGATIENAYSARIFFTMLTENAGVFYQKKGQTFDTLYPSLVVNGYQFAATANGYITYAPTSTLTYNKCPVIGITSTSSNSTTAFYLQVCVFSDEGLIINGQRTNVIQMPVSQFTIKNVYVSATI